MILLRSATICIILFLSLCGSNVLAANSSGLPQAQPNKALIVFYREKKFAGGAIRFNINGNQGPIGALAAGTYLYIYVDPGQHSFWSQVISQDSIMVNAIAGGTYYIEGVVQMGLYAGRPKFFLTTEEKAKAAIAKM